MAFPQLRFSIARGSLLAALALIPVLAFPQGLVEYALILVLADGNTLNSYQTCASNLAQSRRDAIFVYQAQPSTGYQPSTSSSESRVEEVLELEPGETECAQFDPDEPGIIYEVIPGPPGINRGEPDDGLGLSDVWGYRLELPVYSKRKILTQVWITQRADGARVAPITSGVAFMPLNEMTDLVAP